MHTETGKLKKEFLDKLPSDCKMFVIMDCCHSGSNMDLPFCLENGVQKTITKNKVVHTSEKGTFFVEKLIFTHF